MAKKSIPENILISQESKVCSKCGIEKTYSGFHKNKQARDGVSSICKECAKIYKKQYYQRNRKKLIQQSMEWVGNNKERYRRHARKCYHKNIDERRRKSRERAREEDRTEYFTQYRDDNRENIKLLRSMPVSYKTYGHQLTVAELPTEDKDGFLVCVCTYCGKHFKPNYAQVRSRITSLKGQTGGACRIYCSDGCKKACPTYEQKSYPRGFRKGTSREVVSELRKMALERDEYECQRCGKRIGEVSLHVHHINGATQNKMIANDLWNVITFCKTCHEWVHTQKGCRHRELKCK